MDTEENGYKKTKDSRNE